MSSRTLNVLAVYNYKYLGDKAYEHYTDQPMFVDVTSEYFETRDEAEAFAALFPKSAKIRVVSVSSVRWDSVKWAAMHRIQLSSNGVNGGVNESGVKRYRSIMKVADTHGLTVNWDPKGAVNGYESREQFEEVL